MAKIGNKIKRRAQYSFGGWDRWNGCDEFKADSASAKFTWAAVLPEEDKGEEEEKEEEAEDEEDATSYKEEEA